MRKLYIDMEMGSYNSELRNKFPDPKIALHNIISIVAYDNYTQTYHVFVYREDFTKEKIVEKRTLTDDKEYKIVIYKSGYEVDVVRGFALLWRHTDPDRLLGWNSDNFDFPYYFKRCERLGQLNKIQRILSPTGYIRIDWKSVEVPGYEFFDLMKGAKKILGRYVDGSLEAVSQHILGYGKLGDTMSAIADWQHNIDRLIDYNIQDVELTVLLDEKMPIHDYFQEQMAMTGATISDTLQANFKVCQKFIMYNKGVHPHFETFMLPVAEYEKEEFEGAITMPSQVGIHDWVAVHDLSQMYPTIMLACNMSPETVIKKQDHTDKEWEYMSPIHVNGVYFRTDIEGFIPRLIRMQIQMRKDIEQARDDFITSYGEGYEHTTEYATFINKRMNVKGLINSWYGVFGYEKFILYNNDIASCVTYLGRKQLEWSRDFVMEQYNIETIYGDTDSIFIYTPKEIVDKGIEAIAEFHDKVGDAITESYDDFAKQYGIVEHEFSMKFEKLYQRIFFSKKRGVSEGAKKRYVGRIVFKDGKSADKTDISGFQSKRSDTAAITAQCQKKVFDKLVSSPTPIEDTRNIVRKYYMKGIEGNVPYEDMALRKGIGKELRAYNRSSRTYHWYAAQWSNENLGTAYAKGSKPRYIPLQYVPPPYNQLKWYKENEEKWMAFTNDHPLPQEMEEVINWKLITQKSIIEPMTAICESLGIDMQEIATGRRQLDVRKGL